MGKRQTMEDVHVIRLESDGSDAAGGTRVAFVGIWDGHGGVECARYASEHLHANVLRAGLVAAAQGSSGSDKVDVKKAKQAIIEGFRLTDEALLAECASRGWADGTCAVCAWVVGELALVANVGDAKAVLARVSDKAGSEGQVKGLVLTREHLALHAVERARIQRAGGFVSADGRLNGRMQVSRSFGDAQLKSAGASSVPDVAAFQLTPRDRFLVLGCDGFWGVWDAQGCVDAVGGMLDGPAPSERRDEKGVTNRLVYQSVRERGCRDNVSVLLLRFCPTGGGAEEPKGTR
ncbi:hypothetical protein FOA52_008314 [Chlamydomonas sp. UWO 241]|nr:hypothetical protein FOA52_008314 [Chlamydomonas sp. UWO 241]